MRYAQIMSGGKLHLVFEAGEGWAPNTLTRAGELSPPLCNAPAYYFAGQRYRINCNLPLAHACKNCARIAKRHGLT